MGCAGLGFAYEDGSGVEQNTQKAIELYGKACDLDYYVGCNAYKNLQQQGY
ncbi:SEL1-like repeat protein [Helicobacter cinaedi]|uniref:SEL1-like repeat protein n=1 Tax=Helicobacter cinaedi TaxID=213 RepID=UPI000CF115F1|nr:SEL1-like repeat protein [Helicobacter cinaedi]BDB66323.1 hypothetical protein Hc94105_0511 [Helicobacter cinaedi]